MSDEEPDEGSYGLVMPFIVCTSQGGPYEDQAFVAGYTAGNLESLLAQEPLHVETYVPTPLTPQVDLLAMRFGYRFESEPWDEHPDEWTRVEFTKVQP